MNLIEASSLAISRRPFFFAGIAIVIILLLVSLQTFIKNGVQGRFKQAVDDIGDQFSFGNTKVIKIMTTGSIGQTTQDEPYYLESQYAVTRNEAQIQLLD